MKQIILSMVVILGLAVGATQIASAANEYGSGDYGACEYNDCGISVASGAGVSLPVTPTAAGACTTANNSVTVTTSSSTGYTLQVASSTTANALARSGGGTLASTSGTQASPVALAANQWGYRVDGVGGFGAGPTTAATNAAISTRTFAAVPSSSVSPSTIAFSSAPASAGASTNVWYGVCANTAQLAGTYTLNVTYTAVVN